MNLLNEITSGVWAIEKPIADGHMLQVLALMKGNVNKTESHHSERQNNRLVDYACASKGKVYKISEYGLSSSPEDAPEGCVALIGIGGVITKSDQYCGGAGMVTKGDFLKRCDRNPNINAIILQIESGGGEGYAAMHLCDVLKTVQKPVIAFIDDMACSAAYYIASACNHVVAKSNMARIGSIGTYVTLFDYREMLAKEGVKEISVYAAKSKDKNQEYYQAIDGDTSLIQKSINVFNEKFLSDVSENRSQSIDKDEKKWGTGKVFYAPEALELGLIDEIDSLENVINSLLT